MLINPFSFTNVPSLIARNNDRHVVNVLTDHMLHDRHLQGCIFPPPIAKGSYFISQICHIPMLMGCVNYFSADLCSKVCYLCCMSAMS